MKIICTLNSIPKVPHRTIPKTKGRIEIDGVNRKCLYYYGRHNLYAKLSDDIGIRICTGLPTKKVQKVLDIQYVLGSHGLAPMLYDMKIFRLIFKSVSGLKNIAGPLRKAIRGKRKEKTPCIFQEHINITRTYDHGTEKFTEPFISFRKQVRKISKEHGFEDRDLKKGNILVTGNTVRCIDFDDWTVPNPELFKKIIFKTNVHHTFSSMF